MAYKKYFKKKARRVVKRAVKTYKNPHVRGTSHSTLRLARDVAYLKSQINAEHKHIDTTFGSDAGSTYTAQTPTVDTPIIIPLELPVKGTGNYDRIGNQIVVTSITGKYGVDFQNTTDRHVRTTFRARIIFAKDADDVPLIANLLNADPNGEYGPLLYVNEQQYRKYIWLKKLDCQKSHLEMLPASVIANTGTPTSPSQRAKYYPRVSWGGRIKSEFATGTNTSTVNKPYLVLTSNVIEDTPYNWDPVYFSGTVRLTYIDN